MTSADADADDIGGEVRLGSMLFTLVEPHRGHEVAYNRWYETDHFYAGCMVGPWLFAGRRWVATGALKAARSGTQPDLFGGADLGSYLAVYWILDGRHDDHVDWALRQVHWLHANGRMFAERDHVHTLMYRWSFTAGGSRVPAELALDHPFGGMVASLVERADGVPTTSLAAMAGDGLSIGFDPEPLRADAPVTQKGLDDLSRRSMVLTFTPDAPGEVPALDPALGTVLWSAPFIPTIPGTDTYTDQL